MRVDRIHESQWPQYLADLLSTDERADFSPEINKFHSVLEAVTLAAFDAQQSPVGDPWPEWKWRNKQYHYDQRALVASGRLMRSFRRGGGGENVDKINAKTGQYGTNVEYAHKHQFGEDGAEVEGTIHHRVTEKPYGYLTIDIPPRPMLGVSERLRDRFRQTIEDGLVERMRG